MAPIAPDPPTSPDPPVGGPRRGGGRTGNRTSLPATPAQRLTQVQPGNNRPPMMGGGVHKRGPDVRARSPIRSLLVAALADKDGQAMRNLIKRLQESCNSRDPGVIIRLILALRDTLDGVPRPEPPTKAPVRPTFVLEGQTPAAQEAARAEPPPAPEPEPDGDDVLGQTVRG